ncbi:MAG: 50S ribosomal protein L44e [Hadesarchaea archaeon]|nr:50S ribosomal protein L44e [Candidatus Bipolaricaulota bacterium]MBC7218653.1 50S ribosomal protein L44e [Hadesarchaea archaeon]
MIIPKKIRTYCPSCRKHTEHNVSQLKKRAARPLSWGQRQFARVTTGYGSQPRSEQKKFAKTSKKVVLMLKCTVCKKSHPYKGFRSKGVKFGEG